jgi:hypothetical protein
MGHELSVEEINCFYGEFVRLADSKKHICDQDLLSILPRVRVQMPVSGISGVRSAKKSINMAD